MLTPQDIQEKAFAKSFNGYSMAEVDGFLEEIGEDYAALFKENNSLKTNMRALIEKVKEYRATEDAMRGALLTAQKMSDQQIADAEKRAAQIVAEAEKKAAQIVADAEKQYDLKKTEFGRRTAQEVEGVRAARAATAEYLNASRQLLANQARLLADLEKLNRMPEPKKAEPVQQPVVPAAPVVEEDVKVAAPRAPRAPKAEPVQQPAAGGTKVFGSDFTAAVKKGTEGEQYTFDDLDLSILDK